MHDMCHTPYRYVNGYRLVVPYLWNPSRRVPPHWVNETLQDFIASDRRFFKISLDFVKKEIESGRVLVSKRIATPTQKLKHNDIIQYCYHRHEPEVLDFPVTLLQVTKEVVIVNKPPSIPVHPVGEYKKNSIVEIVKYEHPYLLKEEEGKEIEWECFNNEKKILANVHRLDRTVSGLMILARTKSVAQKFTEAFYKRRIKKWYLAKVQGVFPSERIEVNQPIIKVSSSPVLFKVDRGEGSKEARTIFERLLLTEDNCSIVLCHPFSGVSHQLRTHLQWLGYPILGDIKYGGKGRTENDYIPAPPVLRDHTYYKWCIDCQRGSRDISRILRQDLLMSAIHLHALKYESFDPKWAWSYEAPPPKWLTDDSVLYNKLIIKNNDDIGN